MAAPWSSFQKNLVVPSATVWKISDQNNQNHLGRLLQSQNEERSRRREHSDPAEMPSYSQSPSLHDWRLAVLSFCTRLWRMRRGQSRFSRFHCPVWKYSAKIWSDADVRRLLFGAHSFSRKMEMGSVGWEQPSCISRGQQMIQQMFQMCTAAGSEAHIVIVKANSRNVYRQVLPHQRLHLEGSRCLRRCSWLRLIINQLLITAGFIVNVGT